MRIIFSLFLFLSVYAHGQAWFGILAPARAIDWANAGLPATMPTGETTSNPWTPPVRTRCGNPLPNGSSLAAIESAMAACTPGHYVQLDPGTFVVPAGQVLAFYDSGSNAFPGVTLRGSGPMQTTLVLLGLIQYGQVFPGNSATISSISSNSVTLSTVSGLTVGNMLDINQCDTNRSGATCQTGTGADNGGIWVCGNLASCAINVLASANSFQHQMVTVTGIAGNVVSFTPALRLPNWSTANSPKADWLNNKYHSNGIENMTIDERGNANGTTIYFRNAYSSWMKGVRLVGANNANNFQTVVISDCKNCLYINNYLFNNALTTGGSRITIDVGNLSDSLIVNNIQDGGDSLEGEGGSSGSVIAYNYGINGKTEYYYNTFYEHNAGSSFWLHEGNQNGKYQEDATNGTHNLTTLFRNYYTSWDPPYVTVPACNASSCGAVKLDPASRFDNLIGNAVGGSTVTNYIANQINGISNNYAFGFNLNFTGLNDPLTQQTAMMWGNCETSTNTCRFQSSEVPTSLPGNAAPFVNSVPASQTLPKSFFMPGNSAPSWWGVCTTWATFPTSCSNVQTQPYPPVGPDVTGGPYVNGHAYDAPAAVAFKNLPIDTSLQNSYSITASSWSGGTETLTVSGLPTGSHTIGGFQITGNANCNSSAGTEFLMTGSSTTQITYALVANPGSCTGGTVKWPDIRQFDQAVFVPLSGGSQSDSLTPTSFSYGNQNVGSSSSPQAFTLQNTGSATLNISSIAITGPVGSLDFSQTNTCGSTLAVSSSCTINVVFTPSGPVARIGNLTVTSDASNSPTSSTLTGTGIMGFSSLVGVSVGGSVTVH